MLFIDLFVYWLFSIFFPKKKEHTNYNTYHYDTTGLLIADSLIRNDKGFPKTYTDTTNNDPFLNDDYLDGPGW